ncbi:DUF2268 domain-containing putative Zn-dependent protease [Chitinophaga sp. NPDC101104]|uniref:gliding motility protein GldB-related protein n=1 Tax=Chitinophaga sp. NPDC101104 TaxID=3390561 RepID=UPI003D0524D2
MSRFIFRNPFLLALSVILASGAGKVSAQRSDNVYTSDIAHFWTAFDSVQATPDAERQVEIMQVLYIDKGTAGLKRFMQLRNFDARKLVETIRKYPKFWASIRPNTMQVQPQVPVIQQYIEKFRELYPELRPANMYFSITAIRAAGVAIDSTALIGTEITMGNKYTDVSEFPDKRLANFFQSKETNNIIPVSVHEYVHTQQSTEGKSLLGQCIYEGACDFVTELVIGEPLTHSYILYGNKHLPELKAQFQKEMYSEDYSNWLYNGNKVAVGDLGYFMGYAISKAYYEQAKDKKKALREIISLNYADIKAVTGFLNTSGFYGDSVFLLGGH